jgi:predicted nucleic acid-binding Zn ribbon protein
MDTTQRIKLQQALTEYHTNNPKEKKLPSLHKLNCVVCSTPFEHLGKRKTCSVECFKEISSRNGRKNAANRKSRSKDEIELYELCNSYYTNVSHNTVIADGWDADIILNDHNTAILWNGPWHYQDMQLSNHSLLQVQTRDKKKIKLFESLGWSVVIFEDRYYTPAQAFELLKRKISGAT